MHSDAFVPAVAWALPFVGLLLAIALLPLAAPHFWESNLRKLAVALLLSLPVLWLYTGARPEALVACGPRLRVVHRAARRAVRDLGRRHARGRPGGDHAHERAPARRGGAARVVRRDDGRLDAADPAAAADEPRAQAGRAHGRLLHLPGLELRRLPDAARRPAALPRLPRRRAVPVDAAALPGVALHGEPFARGLRSSGTAGTRAQEEIADLGATSTRCGRCASPGSTTCVLLLGVLASGRIPGRSPGASS